MGFFWEAGIIQTNLKLEKKNQYLVESELFLNWMTILLSLCEDSRCLEQL